MMLNTQNTKSLIEGAIKSTQGRFFTVTFRKKDGKLRKMNCRLGVKKHLKGSGNKSTTSAYDNYITVFDMVCREYRTINLDTITEFRGNKATIKVN